MTRFYENLLGNKPLGRATALTEAQSWLRKLSRKDAERLAGVLKAGKLSGTRGKAVDLPPAKEKPSLPKGQRPYDLPQPQVQHARLVAVRPSTYHFPAP
jgi:hypothetical protein